MLKNKIFIAIVSLMICLSLLIAERQGFFWPVYKFEESHTSKCHFIRMRKMVNGREVLGGGLNITAMSERYGFPMNVDSVKQYMKDEREFPKGISRVISDTESGILEVPEDKWTFTVLDTVYDGDFTPPGIRMLYELMKDSLRPCTHQPMGVYVPPAYYPGTDSIVLQGSVIYPPCPCKIDSVQRVKAGKVFLLMKEVAKKNRVKLKGASIIGEDDHARFFMD